MSIIIDIDIKYSDIRHIMPISINKISNFMVLLLNIDFGLSPSRETILDILSISFN